MAIGQLLVLLSAAEQSRQQPLARSLQSVSAQGASDRKIGHKSEPPPAVTSALHRYGLGTSSDDLDVLRLNQGRSICRDVVLGPQLRQIIVQRLSAVVGQRRICPIGRT